MLRLHKALHTGGGVCPVLRSRSCARRLSWASGKYPANSSSAVATPSHRSCSRGAARAGLSKPLLGLPTCYSTTATLAADGTGRPAATESGAAQTRGAATARATIDLRSCLFAECSGSDAEGLKRSFASGADAVGLDAFGLGSNTELADALSAACAAIQSHAPPYQLHFLQIDANLTLESPILPSPGERRKTLKNILGVLLAANVPLECKHGRPAIDGLVLRNVQTEGDVQLVETILQEFDADVADGLKFIPVIESPLSYFASLQIAESSRRNIALVGSSPLLAESTECEDDSRNETITAVKVTATLAAHAAGLVSLCGFHSGDDDTARLTHLSTIDRSTGFDGKVIVNRPDLIPLVNHLYTVSDLEIELANDLAVLVGGTTRTEKDKDTSGMTGQDPEARTRQFKGPPHRAMAEAALGKSKLQKPKVEESMKTAQRLTGLDAPSFLRSHVIDHTTHERLKVGDIVRSSYELTVDESWITMWHMLVYNPRTSEFSAKHKSRLGTHRPVLPFSLAQVLCLGLAVSKLTEKARFHLGAYDSIMIRPLEAGDTFRAFFRVDNKVLTAQGHPVIDTTHVLINQDDKLMFSARKKTMFPASPIQATVDSEANIFPPKLVKPESQIRRHLLSRPTHELTAAQGMKQPVLEAGQVFVHRHMRHLDKSDCMYFCNMLRITNDFHINFFKYDTEQIIMPGPLVMYSAIGNSLPDLGEQLYHEVDLATHINKFNPGDTVGTISYVADARTLEENEALEEVTMKQLGVKNVDMEELANNSFPKSLFALDLVKPADYENICRAHCPVLQRRIVVNVVRRFVRVKPSAMRAPYATIHTDERRTAAENKWFV